MKITNSLPNGKTTPLTKVERSQIVLPNNLASILIGLHLGDAYGRKLKGCVNTLLRFEQGLVHKEYLLHLHSLFEHYCPNIPKIINRAPHRRTGKIYSSIYFTTWSLPCFNEFYELFYVNGVKVVPQNIGELLTPLGLAYWISDDGGFNKRDRVLVLSTQSFTLEEVKLLVNVLNSKWNLKCTINKNNGKFVIRIPSKSVPVLQELLKDQMPSMMKYKIGL